MNKHIGLLPQTQKAKQLIDIIQRYERLMVAFSGGVDSTFLLAAAVQALPDNVTAVISLSPIHAERERKAAIELLEIYGLRYMSLTPNELNLTEFVANSPERCYYCKYYLFSQIIEIGKSLGIECIAHGENIDDLQDYRPGAKAAEELGIKSPLIEAGFTKPDIRHHSREMRLPTWNKPSMACLASRIPAGTRITGKLLTMIESAEETLLSLGFRQCRVRVHGKTARIEVEPHEIQRLMNITISREIIKNLKMIGFERIAADLEGYVQKKDKPIISGR